MSESNVIVFASGTKEKGGSGLRNLINASHLCEGPGALSLRDQFSYKVVGIISNHNEGGVKKIAKAYEIPFEHMTEFSASRYLDILEKYDPRLVALSGWLKYVVGIPFNICINIHPGPTGEYGGEGMHGHHVHEKIYADWKSGKIDRTCVTMHFVTYDKENHTDKKGYDRGPVICQIPVEINPEVCGDATGNITPDSIAEAVNKMEHRIQPNNHCFGCTMKNQMELRRRRSCFSAGRVFL